MKIFNHAYSVATGVLIAFIFDFPLTIQVCIALAFAGAALVVGDVVDALLSLWQAFAVAGLFFVLVDFACDVALNQTACALSIPIVWICILVFKRKFSGVSDSAVPNRFEAKILGVIIVALLFLVVPRGQLQSLSFLGRGEDSALYMWASSGLLRGEELRLATGFGASSYLYFYNFLNNGFLYLSKLSVDTEASSLLIALNVLSNAWVFVLVSSILFSIRIVSLIRHKVSARSSNLGLYILISASTFLFFRASQDVGHYTQYLLNCAVLVFLITMITLSEESRLQPKLWYVFFTFATAVSLVGSYGPWLPMSIIGVALTINAFFRRSLLRSVFNSKYWYVMVLIFVPGWALLLRKLYASSNLEMGGGVAVIPLEAVWLVFVLAIFLIVSLVVRRVRKFVLSPEGEFKSDKIDKVMILAAVVLLFIAVLDRTSFNQLTTISFLVLVGFCFRPISILNLIRNFDSIAIHKEFDGVFILAVTTFLYTLSIYLLSRFIGPIYEPMYAANKSMFMFFGQFSWLLLLLVIKPSKSLSKVFYVTRDLTIYVSIFIVLGLTNFTRYDEVQKQWWHEPSLVALNENPNALIACVNPIMAKDYESYKCNHFISVLSSNNNAVLFERLSLGDPLSSTLSDWFSGVGSASGAKFNDDVKVIVLSQDDLGADALSIFEGVSKNMIEFRVVKP